ALEAGSFGQRGASAQYGWSDGDGRELLFAGSRTRSDGDTLYFREFDTPGEHDGVARGLDHAVVDRLFLKAVAGNASLTLAHAAQVNGDPTASYEQLFGDPRSQARDARTIADLAFRGSIAPDLDWTAHVFAGRYDYRGTYVYAEPPGPLNYDIASARWAGIGVQAIYTGWAGHKLV